MPCAILLGNSLTCPMLFYMWISLTYPMLFCIWGVSLTLSLERLVLLANSNTACFNSVPCVKLLHQLKL